MTNKEIAQRWFEEVWNRKNAAVIDELMAPDMTGITEAGKIKGPSDFRALVYDPIQQAFPDLRIVAEGFIEEGDQVAVKWTAYARHDGPLLDRAATGRSVRFTGMTWLTFREGQIVAGTDSYNLHGLLAYLSSGQECASVSRE
jgi:steroid delta-isomerase-like uncharacterized protein